MKKCINLIQNKTTKCIGLLALMVNLLQNNNNEIFRGCTQGLVEPKKIVFYFTKYILHLKYTVHLRHTVQKLRVISNKCPKTFDSFFSLYGIGTYIKTLK